MVIQEVLPKVVTRGQPSQQMALLLSSYRDEIQGTWVELMLDLPGLKNCGWFSEHLPAYGLRGLDALTVALHTGSFTALESYLMELNRYFWDVGFDVSVAIETMFLFKESIMATFRRTQTPGSEILYRLCASMDACLRFSANFLARHWAVMTNEQLKERQDRTMTLLEVLQATVSTPELEEVLCRVAEAINSVAHGTFCGFCMVDNEQQLLIPYRISSPQSSYSVPDSICEMPPLPFADLGDFERYTLEEQQPAICVDTETDPRVLREWTRLQRIRSILAVPFVVKKRVVAIAFVCVLNECREFSQEQIDLACGIANAVSLSIENARLYQKMKKLAIIEERDRLAREMHDNLAQSLSALQLMTSQVSSSLHRGQVERAKDILEELHGMISEAHTDVRETLFNMHTVHLPVNSFSSMLKEYLHAYSARYPMEVVLDSQVETDIRYDGDAGFQVLRIIQESLTNIRKHTKIQQATIRIHREDDRLMICICDAGCGFDSEKLGDQAGDHMGLQVMRERAESIGGSLKVDSKVGRGTSITLSVPIP